VDAYYEDGAFAVSNGWFSVNGIDENLGWVLDPKNAGLRTKLRQAFAEWYDFANNEKSENCIILAIRITRATVIVNHGTDCYYMDFVNKAETEEGRIR